MEKQIFNEMVKDTDDDGNKYYNHICHECSKQKRSIVAFGCNTVAGLVCNDKAIHYCTACKEANCYFHSSFIINVNYCYTCIMEMTRYQEKKFE